MHSRRLHSGFTAPPAAEDAQMCVRERGGVTAVSSDRPNSRPPRHRPLPLVLQLRKHFGWDPVPAGRWCTADESIVRVFREQGQTCTAEWQCTARTAPPPPSRLPPQGLALSAPARSQALSPGGEGGRGGRVENNARMIIFWLWPWPCTSFNAAEPGRPRENHRPPRSAW